MNLRVDSAGVVWAAIVALLVAIYVIDPVHLSIMPPCPFYYMTGYYCPGCGTTRALSVLVHGQLGRAFSYNPLMVIAIPFLMFISLNRRMLFSPKLSRFVFILIVLYWILRNIPVWPLTLLAPH